MTYAKVIEDSVSPEGRRLTTFEVRVHRFVLAELNTHRTLSRNSASSRAIPFRKQVERVLEDPAMPVVWASEKKGMQGGEELDTIAQERAARQWVRASTSAVNHAKKEADLGLHKSLVNRLLEPFMWHTVICTATAWDNFFRQRVSPLAQPEIRVAAEMMLDAYKQSIPEELEPGDWHLPYIGAEDWEWALRQDEPTVDLLKRVSVARCARVSYLTHEGVREPKADLDLYDRLVSADPMHASPLEHVATPDVWNEHQVEVEGMTLTLPKVGNFLGWRQHRIEVETKKGYQSYA